MIGQEAAEIWLKEINARDGNTLGHIAALKNDPNLFKVSTLILFSIILFFLIMQKGCFPNQKTRPQNV